MRMWLWTIGTASLLMISMAAGAAEYGSAPSEPTPGGTIPPVAQPLVREGDFAVKLAAELDLGLPSTEAAAEDMLVAAGVAPLNGWLSDYPVTPQIIGQLQESVSRAASEGKLPMTADQAVKGLFALAARFDLPTPSAEGQAAAATPQNGPPAAPAYPSDQQAINNYYYDAGPPVVTYYPPPYAYGYLYDWVPYPVWWFGFWFPGFYICHDFSTIVVFQSRPVVVSNHFVDRSTNSVVRVDALGHRTGGGSRATTVLRTERGDRYRTVADLHHGVRMSGSTGERRREGDHAAAASGQFGSARARQGAESIVRNSTMRDAAGRGKPPAESWGSRDRGGPDRLQPAGRDRSRSYPPERYAAPQRMWDNSGGARNRQAVAPARPFADGALTRPAPGGAYRVFRGAGEGYGNGNYMRRYPGQGMPTWSRSGGERNWSAGR